MPQNRQAVSAKPKTHPVFDNLLAATQISAMYLEDCQKKLYEFCKPDYVGNSRYQNELDGRELIGTILGHLMANDPEWMHTWMQHIGEFQQSPRDNDLPLSLDVVETRLGFLNPEHRGKFIDLQRMFCADWEIEHHKDIPKHLLPPFYTAGTSGDGTFAIVEQVQLVNSGNQSGTRIYARKRPKAREHNSKLMDELKTLKDMTRHHHVVRCVGSYNHDGSINILLEPLANKGNFSRYLEDCGSRRCSEPRRNILMKSFGCLISGLGFLSTTMRHKDIKPDNILVHDDTVLFTDFGSAYPFAKKGTGSATSNTVPGNINWMYAAPEVRTTNGQRDVKTDLFSLGCVFTEVIAVLSQKERFTESYKVECYGGHVDELHAWLDVIKGENPELSMPIEWCKRMTEKELEKRPKIPVLISDLRKECESKGKSNTYFCSKCLERPATGTLSTVVEEENESQAAEYFYALQQKLNVNERDIYGMPPLSTAARRGQLGIVKLLLDAKAEISQVDLNEGGTPLHWAVQGGDAAIVALFLETGADIDAQNPFLGSPLSWAVQNNLMNVVNLLLENGADVAARNKKTGLTPLHLAAQEGHMDLVNRLVEAGADITATDQRHRTPLQVAQENQKEEVISLLLAKQESATVSSMANEQRLETPDIGATGHRKSESADHNQHGSLPHRSAMRKNPESGQVKQKRTEKRARILDAAPSPESESTDS
ncbi:hypothetical protein FDECE_4063 [Fusarium decemcellulare]|nr:hypothetical protein FDECE_4063 [Fusarium decemcellulare]